MNISEPSLVEELKDKEYREAFVEEHVRTGVPFQIQALREQRGWTQRELGERAGMAAERISILEDPNYGKFTISTLLRLASAFDVGLAVRFVSFGELAEWEYNLSPASLQVVSFGDDLLFRTNDHLLQPLLQPQIRSASAAWQSMAITQSTPMITPLCTFDYKATGSAVPGDKPILQSAPNDSKEFPIAA